MNIQIAKLILVGAIPLAFALERMPRNDTFLRVGSAWRTYPSSVLPRTGWI